jgi:transcriptional regulator with XRE-family HTH domain
MSELHERLLEERERLDLNQDQFAELGGVKRRAQVNYESGERCPDGRYFSGIAAAGADVQYILTGVRSANALAPDELMLLNGYRALDARGKAGVFGMIGGLNQSPGAIGQQFNAPIHQVAGGDIVINQSKTRE